MRSVSQRLEGIEDGIDRLDERLSDGRPPERRSTQRLEAIEGQLAALTRELASLHAALPGALEPVPAGQERMKVSG